MIKSTLCHGVSTDKMLLLLPTQLLPQDTDKEQEANGNSTEVSSALEGDGAFWRRHFVL